MTDFSKTIEAINAQAAGLTASSKLIEDGANFIPDLTQAPATAATVMSTPNPASFTKEWSEMGRIEQVVNSLEGGYHGLRKSRVAGDIITQATFAEQGLAAVFDNDIENSDLDDESKATLQALIRKDSQANRDFKAQAEERLQEGIREFRDLKARDVLYKQPDAMQRASVAAEGKDFLDGLSAAAGEFFSGDVAGNMIYLAGSSTGAMMPYIAAAAATGGLAGFAGGATVANAARGLVMGAGSYANESGQFILDEMERRSLDPERVSSFRDLLAASDYDQVDRNRAARAAVVSGFDFVSGYATGLRLNPSEAWRTLRNGAAHTATQAAETAEHAAMRRKGLVIPKPQAPSSDGLKVAEQIVDDGLAKTVGRTFVQKAENMATQSAVQGALGGAGEFLGSKAAGQDPNMSDVLFEALGEFTSAPVEVATTAVSSVTDARRRVMHAQAAVDFNREMQAITQSVEAVGAKIGDNETAEQWAKRMGEGRSFSAFAQDLIENGQVETIRGHDPELAKKIEQAAAEGKSVDVPVSDIASIALKDRKAADEIVMDCRPTVDGMSVRQAEEYAKNGRKEAEKRFNRALRQFKVPKDVAQEAKEIGAWIRSRLVEGGFSDDYASAAAAVWQSYLVQRAKLLGTKPKELAKMMGWGLDLGDRETTGKTGPTMPAAAESEQRVPATGEATEQEAVGQEQAEGDEDGLHQEEVRPSKESVQAEIDSFTAANPEKKAAVDDLLSLMSTEKQKDVVAGAKGKSQAKYQRTINSAVQAAAQKAGIDLTDLESPITRAVLVRTVVNDAIYATRVNSSAIGWYDEKVRKCLGYAGAMFPELDPHNKEYDKNEAFRFLYVLATTSNGLKVKENLPLAVRIYAEYKRTGTLPAWGQGTQAEPMIKTIADFDKTMGTFDTIDQMRKFFMTTWTVKQLLLMGYNVAGEGVSERTRGAAIIGPKIGNGFFANLNGLFEALTMDRWFMRTYGRWTGTLIDFKPENFRQKIEAFRSVLEEVSKNREFCAWLKENGNFDVDAALKGEWNVDAMIDAETSADAVPSALVKQVKRSATTFMPAKFRKEYSKIWGGKDKPNSIGWTFYSALKGVERAASKDKVAPAGSGERHDIRSIFDEALGILHQEPGLRRLSMADLQAALWYAEKKIYENTKTSGDFVEDYDQDEAPDYANVMRDVALKNGVPQSKIDEITRRIDKEIADETGDSEGPVRTRYDTLAPKDQSKLFGTRGFGTLRRNRAVPLENGEKQVQRGATAYGARRGVGLSGDDARPRGDRGVASGLDSGAGGRGDGRPLRLTPTAVWEPGSAVKNVLDELHAIKKGDVGGAAPTESAKEGKKAESGAKKKSSSESSPSFEEFEANERTAGDFLAALKAAKATLGPVGACVEEKSIEELTGQDEGRSQCRIFLTPDRKCGFVIKNGDDLVSVFSAKGSNSGDAVVEAAISAGARRLDCFNTILPLFYARHGFRPVSRLKFNREYAPYDWDFDYFAGKAEGAKKNFSDGEPDIVFMVYDNDYDGKRATAKNDLLTAPYTDGEHYGEPYMSEAVAKYAEANKVVQEAVDEATAALEKKAAAKPAKPKKLTKKQQEAAALEAAQGSLFQDAVKLDNEYMAAVEAGDIEKARAMVEKRAKEAGFKDAIPEQAGGWKVRTRPAPKKTVRAYKVFFVDTKIGRPSTLFVGDAQALPVGVWLDAKEAYHITNPKNGRQYVPTFSNPNRVGADGKKKTKPTGDAVPIADEATKAELIKRGFIGPRANSVTAVAYRPGWHAGTLPYFPQGGLKREGSNYGMVHEQKQVVYEIEVAADKDYTEIARSQPKAITKAGKVNLRNADLDYLPKDGMYYYTTNPRLNPQEDGWVITDSIKVVRALSQEECDALLAKAGKLPQEWAQGKMELSTLGIKDPEASDAARKTLAPITYDEDGNVIPLSRRFDPNSDSVLYQSEGRPQIRGQYNPVNVQNPTQGAAGVIQLMRTADKSTFMHESAHAWLDADTTLALAIAWKARAGEELTEGEKAFLKNLGGFFAWGQREGVIDFGADPDDLESVLYAVEQWAHMPVSDQRGMHELFARGFEAYLMNGESPSPAMTTLFQRFRSWLKDVYARAVNAVEPISPEVQKLYDLMFVSEQEAADAEARAGMQKMFDEDDAKKLMTDEERAQYDMLAEEANAESQSLISRAVAGVMRVFTRRSEKERAQILREHKARVKEMEERLMQEPRYKAWHMLRQGWKAKDGTVLRFKLSEAALAASGYDEETIKALRRKNFTTDGQGVSIEQLAQIVHHEHPADLVGELMEVTSAKDEAADIVASMVQEETGMDINRYSRLKADLAAHNTTRSRMLTAEHNAVARLLGKSQILKGAAREYAQKRMAGMKMSEINPYAYENDERRCAAEAERAWRAGDYERCLEMKRAQIVNHEMARAALEIKDAQVKCERRLKRALKSKGVHPANQQLLAYIAAQHGIVPVPKALMRQTSKDAAIKVASAMLAEGVPIDGLSPDPETGFAQSSILDDETPVKDMTFEQARDLFSMLQQIEKVGRDRLTIERNGIKRDAREEIKAGTEALESAAKMQGKERIEHQRVPKSTREKMADALKQYFYAHIKIATWCRIFDRNRDGGFFWNHFIRSANELASWEEGMRAELGQKLQDIFNATTDGKKGIWDKEFVKIGRRMMSKGERMAAALNLGNESNRQRLIAGEPEQWTGDALRQLEESLTPEEWQAVQRIWDLFESLRPLIAEKQKRVYGVEPVWIDVSPVTVTAKGGRAVQLRGGYYPVVYDPRGSKRAEQLNEAAAAQQLMKSAFQSSTTNRSFTKQRAEVVLGRPLRLDLSALYSGLDDVIHDVAWHEWLINTQRLLNGVDGDGSGLSRQISELYGYHVARAFDEWAQAIAQGDRSSVDGPSRTVLKWLAGNIGVTAMGFSVSSAVSQVTGIGYIVPRAGVAATLGAIRDAVAGRKALRDAINEKSSFMRTRYISANRQISEVRNRLEKGDEGIKRYAYVMMMGVQHVVDTICWQAQYRRCMAEGMDEAEAIARADQAVIDTQSSGRVSDEAAVERSDILGPFTVFYSWANAALNMEYAYYKSEEDRAKRLAALTFYAILMPQIDALLKDCLKASGDDDDDDDDSWLDALIRRPFANAAELHFGMFVGFREISSTVRAVLAGEKTFDYAGPGGTRGVTVAGKGVESLASLFSAVLDEDAGVSWKDVNAMIDVTGLAVGAPTSQIKRTIKGIRAIGSGQAEGFDALKAPIFGFDGPIDK